MIRFLLLSLLLLPAAFACLLQAAKAGKTGVINIRFSGDKFTRSDNVKFFTLLRRVLLGIGIVLLLAWLQLAWDVFA